MLIELRTGLHQGSYIGDGHQNLHPAIWKLRGIRQLVKVTRIIVID